MGKRIYVAGGMRGYQFYHHDAFDSAAKRLREFGYEVINPAEIDRRGGLDPYRLPCDHDWNTIPAGFDLNETIRRDIDAVLDVDGVAVLDGWNKSKGASAEAAVAAWRGIPVFPVETWISMARPQPVRVGLCGYARVGKDTICRAMGLPRLAFADELKRDVSSLVFRFGLDPLVNDEHKALCRDLLVAYGALGRKVKPEVWIERMEPALKAAEVAKAPWCVTDVRYANEVQFLRDRGATVVRVHRAGFGPVNEEEKRSFTEIEQAFPYMTNIINEEGKAGEAASGVLELASKG